MISYIFCLDINKKWWCTFISYQPMPLWTNFFKVRYHKFVQNGTLKKVRYHNALWKKKLFKVAWVDLVPILRDTTCLLQESWTYWQSLKLWHHHRKLYVVRVYHNKFMIKELIYKQCQRCDSIVKNKKAASFLKAGGGRLIPKKILPEDKKDICQWKS